MVFFDFCSWELPMGGRTGPDGDIGCAAGKRIGSEVRAHSSTGCEHRRLRLRRGCLQNVLQETFCVNGGLLESRYQRFGILVRESGFVKGVNDVPCRLPVGLNRDAAEHGDDSA